MYNLWIMDKSTLLMIGRQNTSSGILETLDNCLDKGISGCKITLFLFIFVFSTYSFPGAIISND